MLGLFLPVLQGILFLAIGFLLLSMEWRWARLQVLKARRRHPRFAQALERAEARLKTFFRR